MNGMLKAKKPAATGFFDVDRGHFANASHITETTKKSQANHTLSS